MKQQILNLQAGDLIWNIGGLSKIVEITAKGISVVTVWHTVAIKLNSDQK